MNKSNDSLFDQCSELGEMLGLNEPVSEDVLKASLQDENYANKLLSSKDSPEVLLHLLNNPPQHRLDPQAFSTGELVARAAGALLRWSKTGFKIVDDEALERRENACLACPNLRGPETLLEIIIPSSSINDKPGNRTGNQVCRLCGCNVNKKIRLISESCPAIDLANPELTRWGEVVLRT